MRIVGFTGLVFTMWIRAVFAIILFGSAALMDGVVTAQPQGRDRSDYGVQTPHDRLKEFGIAPQAPRFARPTPRQGLIVTAQITKAQAVRAAIRCNRGGEALKPPVRRGQGFVVKVLKGSYVRNIRVDRNGQCR